MNVRQLFKKDRAVSPVIGVILMVAITVILAAVIGTFVLGLGNKVGTTQPNVQFDFEYSEDSPNRIEITHSGGESLQTSQLQVQVEGEGTVWQKNGNDNYVVDDTSWEEDEIIAGASLSLGDSGFTDGDSVKVIWSAEGSDNSAVIGESEVAI